MANKPIRTFVVVITVFDLGGYGAGSGSIPLDFSKWFRLLVVPPFN